VNCKWLAVLDYCGYFDTEYFVSSVFWIIQENLKPSIYCVMKNKKHRVGLNFVHCELIGLLDGCGLLLL